MSNARFSIVPSKAVKDSRITPTQFRTLSALGLYGDENGWCYPKLKTLAELLGKSKQAVSRDIQALVALGYVEVYHQYREDGSQTHNNYRLIFDQKSPPAPEKQTGGGQRHVDGGSTSGVDGGSTSEVDALTTHINAPSITYSNKSSLLSKRKSVAQPQKNEEDNGFGEVVSAYEQASGMLTPLIADTLRDLTNEWQEYLDRLTDNHPAKQLSATQVMVKAIRHTAERIQTVNVAYLRKVLASWRTHGIENHYKSKSSGNGKPMDREDFERQFSNEEYTRDRQLKKAGEPDLYDQYLRTLGVTQNA